MVTVVKGSRMPLLREKAGSKIKVKKRDKQKRLEEDKNIPNYYKYKQIE